MLDKLKEILKAEGMTGKDLADLLGITYGSYRVGTRKNKTNPPAWVRAFIIGYFLREKNEKQQPINKHENKRERSTDN